MSKLRISVLCDAQLIILMYLRNINNKVIIVAKLSLYHFYCTPVYKNTYAQICPIVRIMYEKNKSKASLS